MSSTSPRRTQYTWGGNGPDGRTTLLTRSTLWPRASPVSVTHRGMLGCDG